MKVSYSNKDRHFLIFSLSLFLFVVQQNRKNVCPKVKTKRKDKVLKQINVFCFYFRWFPKYGTLVSFWTVPKLWNTSFVNPFVQSPWVLINQNTTQCTLQFLEIKSPCLTVSDLFLYCISFHGLTRINSNVLQ